MANCAESRNEEKFVEIIEKKSITESEKSNNIHSVNKTGKIWKIVPKLCVDVKKCLN
jgi:pyruvate/2-oxoglutarate/acetoin dehydrogenase E1 component